MKALYRGLLLLLLAACTTASTRGQQKSPSSDHVNITSPTIPPTISYQTLYALGKQNGELSSMNARLDKIETKLDDVGTNITRINTIGLLAGIFVTVFLGPLAVERWKHVLVPPHENKGA